LRQTNLFSRINYQLIRNINDPNKDYILLSLTEKPSLTLDFSLGYSSDNLFSLGTEFNHNNLFGDMVQWKTQLELGLFWGHQSGLQNLFRWPQIYGLPLNLKLIIPQITFTNFVDMQPVERHLLLQLIANLDWQLSNKFLPFFQYEIRWDKWLQKDTEPASFSNLDGLLLTTQEDSTARIILTPGIRYIDLDHPFNPTNGLQLNLSANFSFALLGEQFPFTIFNTQIIHYITKGPFTFASQIIFRRAFIKSPRDNWWELKYQSDMETLGGDLTVRGYQPNTIGIFGALRNSRDGKILKTKDGQEIEDYHPGNMSLQANFEIRFPLKKNLFIGDLNGVVFTDFGLIDNCTGLFQCSLGTAKEQINQQLGWSVGLGLRYILPIGPISFDWAISPIRQNPSSWLGYESRFHLLFGYMF
ncbi:MAG: BamA/TamA family outer membrane protein, partial [bacterium]|nr:BamA/TamA family outer membrane protein [bacterium]